MLGLAYEVNGGRRVTDYTFRTKILAMRDPTEPTMQIQTCPPTCPAGYSASGVLKPGWIQPRCVTFPCPAIYVGENGGLPIITDVKAPNGDTVTVTVDENGDVVAAEKKPNLLPLAAAAGLAWLMFM